MKKFVSIILLFAMMLSLAACRGNVDPVTEPTGEPNAAADTAEPTEAPTEEPTAEPTEAPTEEPTPEPTAVPEPTGLAFDDCAEVALRLPWGSGETEVYIQEPIEGLEDDDWVIPQHFNITDGRVYVLDLYYYYGNGLLECDLETGAVTRLAPDVGDYNFFNSEFAVLDGKLIFGRYIFDLETGERTDLQPISDYSSFPSDGILIMSVRNGKCYAYKAVPMVDQYGEEYVFAPDTHAYDEYELDMENRMWVLMRRIEMPEYVPHYSPEHAEDSEFDYLDRYMGMDDAGNHYVDSLESTVYVDEEGTICGSLWHRISKLSPEGQPLSYVDVYFPDDYIDMWLDDNNLIFKVDGDGTVWYMCETEPEFLVYKISL